jgi:hypothetical protein
MQERTSGMRVRVGLAVERRFQECVSACSDALSG